MAKMRTQQRNLDLANEHFKAVLKDMKNIPPFEFLYYYERSFYYAAAGNEAKQIASLEKAIEIPDSPQKLFIMAHFGLGKLYLYNRKEPQKAIQYLSKVEQLIQTVDIETFRTKVKTYEMLSDAFQALQDNVNATRAKEEADRLRERLDRLS